MDRYFVGLDVSKDETAICIRSEEGSVVLACKTETDPDAIAAILDDHRTELVRVIIETGRMANWLHDELNDRGLPAICVDARQAHAVLGQMHNKTDANDAAMLAELARTGFFRKVVLKSRQGQERRALLAAREAAINARRNIENTIRGLLASFGIKLPKHPRTYEARVHAAHGTGQSRQDHPAASRAAHGGASSRCIPDKGIGAPDEGLRRLHAPDDELESYRNDSSKCAQSPDCTSETEKSEGRGSLLTRAITRRSEGA